MNTEAAIIPRIKIIQDYTTVVVNSDKLDIKSLIDGILIVYAGWSGQAIINLSIAVKLIHNARYKGQVIIIDIDCMSPEFQISTLGELCHGWGEIFFVSNGQITRKFIGKDGVDNFSKYFLNL